MGGAWGRDSQVLENDGPVVSNNDQDVIVKECLEFELFEDLPVEIYLGIFKFLPPDSLMNVITSCKKFYECFEYYKNRITVIPKVDLKDLRLKYVNGAWKEDLPICNNLSVFNNLVSLQDDDFKRHLIKKIPSERMKGLASDLSQFKERFYERIGSTRKVVEEVFNVAAEKSYKFIIAGSSILNCLTSDSMDFNDLDFFLIRGTNKTDNRVDEELKEFLVKQLKRVIKKKFFIFLNRSYFTICLEPDDNEAKDPVAIQINFRSCRTYEELLSMFDLDCCRFAFDGTHVYTTHQGIRFLNFGFNIIPMSQKLICFRNRLEKYWKRGIDTIYTDSNRYYHPFLSLFTDEEINKLTAPISFSKNRHLPHTNPKFYGNEYKRTIRTMYHYPIANFPMTYTCLKQRHLDSMYFHQRHECINMYDFHSYFILDKFEDLEGHEYFGGYMKPCDVMINFRDYIYFFRRPTGTIRTSRETKIWAIKEDLIMLDFKFCKTCLVYYNKSKPHKCGREKEITMSKMFGGGSSDESEGEVE